MRRKVCALMMIPALLLTGCGKKSDGERAEELLTEVRGEYLEAAVCTGQAAITADYGQRVYTYDLTFSWQREGETVLTITSPENVAVAVARIAEGETVLEYDGVMVETGPLDADGLTPMGAVPALLACVREGYLAECILEDWDGEERLHITSRETEKSPGQGVETQLWFDAATHMLLRGEISQEGTTVLQCDITGFAMQKEVSE